MKKSGSEGRRPNGDGSIWIDQNGQRWVLLSLAQLTEGRDTRRIKRKVLPNTQANAEKLLASLKDQATTGVLSNDVPLFGEVANYWLRNIKARQLAEKSVESYDYQLRMNILPRFGDIRVNKIRPADIDSWINEMSGKFSEQTTTSAYRIFAQIMKFCLRREHIQSNPTEMIDPPTIDRHAQRATREPWTLAEITEILEHLGDSRLGRITQVALACTLRLGEVLGLTWDMYDGEYLTINKQVQQKNGVSWQGEGRKTELRFKKPKSAAGIRKLPLSAELAELLNRHKEEQEAYGKAWLKAHPDEPWNPDNLLFPSRDGTALYPTNISHEFTQTIREMGTVPARPFHTLRGTGATLMSEAGAPVRDIQGMLGHSSADITLEVYARSTEEGKKKAVEGLSSRLKSKLDKPTSEE